MNYNRGILMKIHLVCALMGAAILQSKAELYGQIGQRPCKKHFFQEIDAQN